MTAAVKTIVHPETGKSFRLGRQRPVARCPRLRLRNYLYRALPAPPAAVDYSAKAAPFLAQILGNDELGDCTAAGAFHIGGTLLANAGQQIPFTQDDAIKFYSATTGYVPGDESTDQGGDEETVLNWWQTKGLLTDGSHKIVGCAAVNGADLDEIKTALWLFENLYFGASLPDKWINPMPSASGFVWDVAGDPDQENGHCFCGVGFAADSSIIIDTWGMLGSITAAAVAKYTAASGGGQLFTVFGPDSIASATQKAPNGFDATQLSADLDSLQIHDN